MSGPWTMAWGEHTVTDDDLTNRDLVDAETLVGNGWASADPWTGPTAALSVFAAVIVRRTGRPLSAIADELADLPAGTIRPVARVLEVDVEATPSA